MSHFLSQVVQNLVSYMEHTFSYRKTHASSSIAIIFFVIFDIFFRQMHTKHDKHNTNEKQNQNSAKFFLPLKPYYYENTKGFLDPFCGSPSKSTRLESSPLFVAASTSPPLPFFPPMSSSSSSSSAIPWI